MNIMNPSRFKKSALPVVLAFAIFSPLLTACGNDRPTAETYVESAEETKEWGTASEGIDNLSGIMMLSRFEAEDYAREICNQLDSSSASAEKSVQRVVSDSFDPDNLDHIIGLAPVRAATRVFCPHWTPVVVEMQDRYQD